MRNSSKWIFLFSVTVFSLFIYIFIQKTPVVTYVTAVKTSQSQETLKEIITQKALELDEPPVNARTDHIWGNIPGYDGVVVDKEATLQLALKQKDTSNIHYIYEIIEAEVKLEQLNPNPIYRGNDKKQAMSLMINVAWGTEYLESMLHSLKQYNVKATFFLDGSWANKNRDWVKRIYEAGHEIGNHAYTHPNMSTLSDSRMKEEIVRTDKVIEEVIGKRSTLFAPPSGDYNKRVVEIAHQEGMKTILWTLDTVDWRKPSPETIVNRIVPKAENGALVLMHPTESTAKALPTMIEGLQKKNVKLVTVSEMLSPKRGVSLEDILPF